MSNERSPATALDWQKINADTWTLTNGAVGIAADVYRRSRNLSSTGNVWLYNAGGVTGEGPTLDEAKAKAMVAADLWLAMINSK